MFIHSLIGLSPTHSSQVTSAISSFYLAMVLHPEVQRAAQAELDRVVGQDRLPELTDRESLPLITAIMWEVLRLVCTTVLYLSCLTS